MARLVARICRRWPKPDPAPRQLRLRPRGADGLVRGAARRLPLRPGPQPPAPRRDRHRSGLGRGRTPGDGQAGAPVQGLLLCHPRQLEPAAGDRQGRAPGQGRQPALHRHLAETQGDRCPDPMENRIKECQLDLWADRTSTATMAANQLRLWFSSLAYVLLEALRRIGLPHTELAQATCGTIRLKLLKLGARVTSPSVASRSPSLRPARITPSSPWRMPGCAHRPAEPEARRRRANDRHSGGRPHRLAMVADPQDTPPYRETDVSTAEAGQNTASCPPISRRDRPDTQVR